MKSLSDSASGQFEIQKAMEAGITEMVGEVWSVDK